MSWTDCYIDPSSGDHSSTSSSCWLGLLNHGSMRVQSPLSAAGSHYGILTSTNSNRPGHLVILLFNFHLLPLLFRLFILVHLLIDGSVEGHNNAHTHTHTHTYIYIYIERERGRERETGKCLGRIYGTIFYHLDPDIRKKTKFEKFPSR